MADFGDEAAEKAIESGGRKAEELADKAISKAASGIFQGAKGAAKALWQHRHAGNASVADEMHDVMDEAEQVMSSPTFKNNRVYAIGTGATLRRGGEGGDDVWITYNFSDNELPDGSTIDNFEQTQRDVIRQLKAAGAPEFDFEITDAGIGTLHYKYADQVEMSAVLKQSKLAFQSLFTEARELEIETVPAQRIAEDLIEENPGLLAGKTDRNGRALEHFSDLNEEAQKEFLDASYFQEYVKSFNEDVRHSFKVQGVDVKCQYDGENHQTIVQYVAADLDSFNQAKKTIQAERAEHKKAAAAEAKKQRSQARRSQKSLFSDKEEHVKSTAKTLNERTQKKPTRPRSHTKTLNASKPTKGAR